MRATLSFDIAVASSQKATALRDKHADLLRSDPDVTVTNESMSQRTSRFKVTGVDGQEPFTETVEAEDEDDAQSQVVGKSKTKVVAEVRREP